MVATKSPVKRILAALGALDAAREPMGRLQAARRLREAAEQLEAAQVEAARKAGATWIDIGACYGLTKQGAQQRFRGARNHAMPAKAVTVAPADAKARPVPPAGSKARPVAPAGAKARPVPPAGSKAEPVAPAGAKARPVAPAGAKAGRAT